MPYALERMDRIYRMGNKIARIPAELTEPPSHYMAGQVYGCFFEDDYGIANRDAVGIDQITFECDYPHQDSTWPHTYDYLSQAVADLPEEDQYKIARGNAIEMLGLEPELPGFATASA
jgi:predicted TIM-barrel fold metal-dependent hydrolase